VFGKAGRTSLPAVAGSTPEIFRGLGQGPGSRVRASVLGGWKGSRVVLGSGSRVPTVGSRFSGLGIRAGQAGRLSLLWLVVPLHCFGG